MIPSEEREDIPPLCPHCGSEITRIWFREVESFFGKRFIYFCANCRKTLGISHRKGFWMG